MRACQPCSGATNEKRGRVADRVQCNRKTSHDAVVQVQPGLALRQLPTMTSARVQGIPALTRRVVSAAPAAQLGHEGHGDAYHRMRIISHVPCVYRTLLEDLRRCRNEIQPSAGWQIGHVTFVAQNMPSTPQMRSTLLIGIVERRPDAAPPPNRSLYLSRCQTAPVYFALIPNGRVARCCEGLEHLDRQLRQVAAVHAVDAANGGILRIPNVFALLTHPCHAR